MRHALTALLFAAIAFVAIAIPVYLLSWRLMGLDALRPDDSPVVVLGAWVCCVRTVAISLFVAICTFLFLIIASRHKRRSRVDVANQVVAYIAFFGEYMCF